MSHQTLLTLFFAFSPLSAGALTAVVTTDQVAKRETIKQLLQKVSILQTKRIELKAKFEAVRGKVDYDPVELRAISAAARGIDHQIAGLGESAVALTIDIYGIAPPNPTRPILDKSDFNGGTATWAVQFARNRSYTTWNPKKHEYETFSFNSPNVLGITWPDGTIMVTERALVSPGILAATLVHETVHYDQRTLPHGARVGDMEREIAAFGSVISNDVQTKLGLTADDVKALTEAHAAFMADPGGYLPRVGGGGSPFEGASPSDSQGYGEFGIEAAALARLNDQSAGLRRSIEGEATARSQYFIGRMNAGANTIAAGFRTEAASHCNLMAINAEANQYTVRVGRGQPVILRYSDADGFYVAALLAQACTVPWQSAPCNDAMTILNGRWQDRSFRESIVPAAGTDERIGYCFWHLVKRLKPTDDFQRVRERVAEFEEANRPESTSPTPPPSTTPRAPRERETRPTRPPDIPHCRHMGPWCDGTQDPRP